MDANAPSDQYLCAFILMMSPVFFYIIHLFRKDANRNLFISIDLKMIFGCLEMKRFINSALFQSVAPAHDSSQESYQYSHLQSSVPVPDHDGCKNRIVVLHAVL